ncbi:MAG TPA: efflux transporter outer membrane subunit [Usitatibacter sp.]|nr:efflux transporter outer membrane subunit [Usitatibacter sp.]
MNVTQSADRVRGDVQLRHEEPSPCGVRSSALHLRSSAFPTFLLSVALAGCAIGPDYERPAVETPAAYKESKDWSPARPADAVAKGKWWEVFGDPVLNGLVEQVSVSNQTLAAAEARYRQASAAVGAARSNLFPSIGADAGATRAGRGTSSSGNTTYDASLDARWEIDLWGRVRRQVEASRAGEQASEADLENARLSLQAQLASAYFSLRVADAGRELLLENIKAFETSYRIAQNRYNAGVAAKVDVVTAEAQLKSVQAQELDLRATRASLEHAIAVLVGEPPSSFSVAPVKFDLRLPEIPAGLPSQLLERRPDVAAAERRMAAANERIGIAQAAYFPSLSLTGSGGVTSTALSTLFKSSSLAWSLGAGLGLTLLDFGAREAEVKIARAGYDEAVANYRASVLAAFQDVEDSLATLRWLSEENEVQRDAVRLARESVQLTLNQYKAGTVGYLNVVLLQASQLNEERQAVQLVGRQLNATVALIRALGGAWGSPGAAS